MDLQALIERGQELRSEPFDSPLVDIWQADVRDAVKPYGESMDSALQNAMSFAFVITSDYDGQQQHNKMITDVQKVLEALKSRQPTGTSPQTGSQNSSGPLADFHPVIRAKCTKLYSQGDYGEAVEKGFKAVRARLRELSSYEKGSEAFGRGNLYIRGAAETHVDSDFQTAVRFLTMSIDFFRNEKAHVVDSNIEEPVRAREYLAMASLALRHLDNAEIKQKT